MPVMLFEKDAKRKKKKREKEIDYLVKGVKSVR